MIPLSLQIQGLYSYQEKQTIDFTRLIDAELFGIFGHTGSGKSSILDAIYLTLYGKCERLKGIIAGGTNYNMMNLKSNKLYLDFEFLDSENKKYKFTLETSRNKKNFDSIKPLQRKFFLWDKNNWLPLENPDVEQIVGLNYDNFRRTIIIPQGKFQEFIHLKSTDRERMLIDIFGLQKFDLSENTKTLLQKNFQEIDRTTVLLHQYEEVTEEFIESKKTEKELLISEQHQLEKEITQVRVKLNKGEALKSLFQKKQQLELQLEELWKQKDSFQKRQNKLDQYILCLEKFSSQLTEHENYSRQLSQSKKNLNLQQISLEKSKSELKSKNQAFTRIKEIYENRNDIRDKADEYDNVIQILDIVTNIAGKNHRLEEAKKYFEKLEQDIDLNDKEQEQLESQQEKIQNNQIDEDELRNVENWFHQQESLNKESEFLLQNEEKLNISISEAKEKKKTILSKTSLDPRQRELTVQVIIQLLEQDAKEIKDLKSKTQNELQQAQLNFELTKISKNLQVGDPCPVCGSTHHPQLNHTFENNDDPRKIERKLTKLENQETILTETLPQLRYLLDQSKSVQKEVIELKKAKDQLSDKINQHRTNFIWKNYDMSKPDMVKKAIGNRKQKLEDLEIIHQRIKSLKETQKEFLSKKELYASQAEQIRNQLSGLEGQFEAKLNNLKYLDFEKEKLKSPDALKHERQKSLDEFKEIGNTYEQFSNQIKEQEKQINILQGRVEGEQKNQEQILKLLAKLNQKLESRIAEEGYKSLIEISEILNEHINIDSEKESIRRYQQNLTEVQTSLKDINEDIGDQNFNEENFILLKKQELELSDSLDKSKQHIGILTESINQLESKFKEKNRLQLELGKMYERRENLKILEGLFKGKGFVKYVSTMHLENLCVAANQRFTKLSNNSLSLEVDAENNFYVRDLMNEGRRRSIKTLSGGQTFQAALCLALALSDQVQKQVKAKQNFFFLDEGFGSQDKNSLQVIFQTLKSLRKENRIVGVISHVEELQTEIENHLKIELDTESGSRIMESWR
ncbi:MAG: AAA family ATPase [Bacteroidia bacterium]|nr:AAA family ATPase [Bacteroidia bacterium]